MPFYADEFYPNTSTLLSLGLVILSIRLFLKNGVFFLFDLTG